MKRICLLIVTLLAVTMTMSAQGVKPLPTLHVEGRWLVDNHGNHVVLHGVMDTPSAYFNGGRWGWSYDNDGRLRCLEYFEKLFTGLETAKCNVFRLHLEPAWTNDPSSTYVYAGSVGQASDATGEADISKFNPQRLKTYLSTLYFPLAKRAMNHGMFVVMRPPGVCPHDLKVGDYYQQYLLTVWDIVSKDKTIQSYAGQISLELANEPVNLKNANGESDTKALHDYFQPIVDKIRANGFKGIIWVPGTGWQANYADYAKNPIEGYNIGYAVHDYTGWYGCSDATPDPTNKINQFHNQVPVVDTNPIIITEVDWSPENPNAQGHYNEHGQWVVPNLGTWSTGTTSKWGNAYKTMLDYYQNISMTLSGTSCLIDIDTLINKQKVVAAFNANPEACGKACMDWYKDYYEVDWPHADDEEQPDDAATVASLTVTNGSEVQVGCASMLKVWAKYKDDHYRDVTAWCTYEIPEGSAATINYGMKHGLVEGEVPVKVSFTDAKGNEVQKEFTMRSSFFPFGKSYISTSLYGNGTYTESTRTFQPSQYGQMGWEFPDGADMSAYKYLVVKLKETSYNSHLNIYTANSIWSPSFSSSNFANRKTIGINLQGVKYTSDGDKKGQPIENNNIHIVCFWGNGQESIVVDDVYLTNNSDYSKPDPASGIENLTPAPFTREEGSAYNLQGQKMNCKQLKPGLYIVDGRKVVVK